MSIIPSFPNTLTNGTLADASQVMADFYQIQTSVNTNAAAAGANTNITSLTGLTTPLAIAYGGTGQSSASAAAAALGALQIANNLSDIGTPSVAATNLGLGTGNTPMFMGLGIGAANNGYNLSVIANDALLFYVGSTGSTAAVMALDNAAGGHTCQFNFNDAGAIKWVLEKLTNNQFSLFDSVGSKTFINAITGGALTLGAAQNVTIDQSGNLIVGGNATVTGNTIVANRSYGDSTTNAANTAFVQAALLQTALGVGSIIMAASSLSTISSGSSYAAASLTCVSLNASAINGSVSPIMKTTGDTLSGTWKALISCNGSANYFIALFQRIA